MKSLKFKLLLCLLFVFSFSVNSQNLETIKVYHDYSKTRLSEAYTVIKNTATKQGLYKSYDKDGGLLFEMNFNKNLANGLNKIYHASVSASLTVNPNASYGKLWKTFNYVNGVLEGSSKIYYYDKGKQVLRFESIYKNDEIVKEIEYFNNGIKKSSFQKNGICNQWYETGEKMLEFTNIDNINNGLHTELFKNGKINVLGNYNKNGKEEGIWKIWDENGNLTETLYENGLDVEKDKARKEKKLKEENELNEKIRKKQEADKLERNIQLEKKRLKDEKEQQINLIDKRIKSTNDKLKEIEKKYVVIDDIQTSLFGKEIYKTKKKNLYNAFVILSHDLSNKINGDISLDEKVLFLDTLEKLLDKVSNFSDLNTKDLEKELKNVTDLNVIKEIFKL